LQYTALYYTLIHPYVYEKRRNRKQMRKSEPA
jgi:hypothetical protein